MSRKKMEIEEGREVVRCTVVGGRPAAQRKRTVSIPIGIEKVLCRAAAQPEFARALLDDRDAALAALGEDLSASERATLAAVPRESLAVMLRKVDLERHGRRRFMRGVVRNVNAE